MRSRLSDGSNNSRVTNGGFTPAASVTEVGSRTPSENQSCRDWATLALLGTDAVARSDAQMAADIAVIQDNLEQGRDLDFGLAWVPERYWDGRDVATSPGVTKPTWTDRRGGGVLTRAGAPQAFFFEGRT